MEEIFRHIERVKSNPLLLYRIINIVDKSVIQIDETVRKIHTIHE